MDNEDPIAAQFTWENGTPQQQMSQYIDPNAVDPGLIDMGPQGPAPQQLPPGAKSVGAGQSSSSSHRGMTAHGLNMSGNLYDQAEAQTQGDMAPYQTELDQDRAQLGKDYGSLAQSAADQGTAEREHYDRTTELMGRQSDFLNHSADVYQQIQAHGDQVKAQYLGDYEEQLAGVRALAAASGNPLSGMGGSQAAGMAMANFAQGWLATRGIHIDVSGQIDRWISRSLQERQQQVENARGSAQDTLHLYDIARQTSNDQTEALLKYRGMVIEGFKSATEMEAARFGSGIASAKAQERVAQLDAELTKTKIDLGDKARTAYVQFHTMRFNEAHQRGQLAIESDAKNEAARHNMAMEGIAKAKEVKEKPQALQIVDPRSVKRDASGKITSQHVVAEIDPNLKPEIQNEIKKQTDEATKVYGQIGMALDRVRVLRTEAMKSSTLAGKSVASMLSPERREFNREVTMAMMDARHAIAGSNLTANEKEEWDKLLPSDSAYQVGTNSSAIDQFEKHFRDKWESTVNYVSGINPAEGSRQMIGGPNETDAHLAVSGPDALGGHGPAVRSAIEKESELAGESAGNQTGGNTLGGNGSLDEAIKPAPEVKASNTWKQIMSSDTQPAHADNVEHLALAIVDPAAFREKLRGAGEIDENDETVRQHAIEGLERVKSYDDPVISSYAFKLLTLATHAPDKVKELLEK